MGRGARPGCRVDISTVARRKPSRGCGKTRRPLRPPLPFLSRKEIQTGFVHLFEKNVVRSQPLAVTSLTRDVHLPPVQPRAPPPRGVSRAGPHVCVWIRLLWGVCLLLFHLSHQQPLNLQLGRVWPSLPPSLARSAGRGLLPPHSIPRRHQLLVALKSFSPTFAAAFTALIGCLELSSR